MAAQSAATLAPSCTGSRVRCRVFQRELTRSREGASTPRKRMTYEEASVLVVNDVPGP